MMKPNETLDMSEIKAMINEMGEDAFVQYVVDNEFMFQPVEPREVYIGTETENLLEGGWPLSFPTISLEAFYIRLESAYGVEKENFCTCRKVKVVKD